MIKSFFRFVLKLLHFPGAILFACFSIFGALGFAHPLLDLFSHLQLVWLAGTFAALLITGLVYRSEVMRAFMIALSATGFLASAVIVAPEAAAGMLARPPVSSASGRTYTLLSYNVFGRNYSETDVAGLVASVRPDVIALQEYFTEMRGPLHPVLVKSFPYFVYCVGIKRENVAIYSKFPFEITDHAPCNQDPLSRTARLNLRFTPEPGRSFTLVTTQNDWPLQISPILAAHGIPSDASQLWSRQQGQFASLSSLLDTLEGPLLLAGDFNSASWSYAIRDFALANHLTRQARFLLTYPKLFDIFGWRETSPFIPLDQVFSRGGVVVHDIHTANASGSDHLPLVTVFSLAK